MMEADLTQEEVPAPMNHWCQGLNGGHSAPEEWEIEKGRPLVPTRFFRVTGHGVDMTVCEPCLIVSRWWSKQIKKGNVL